ETLVQVAAAADVSVEEARIPLQEFVGQAVNEEPLQKRLRTPHGLPKQALLEESRGELEAREWAHWRPRLLWLLGEMDAPSLE
ncbi:unnamed protein product, partial [Prorocentrum cordatum]